MDASRSRCYTLEKVQHLFSNLGDSDEECLDSEEEAVISSSSDESGSDSDSSDRTTSSSRLDLEAQSDISAGSKSSDRNQDRDRSRSPVNQPSTSGLGNSNRGVRGRGAPWNSAYDVTQMRYSM
ncbi:hypothetical protein RRG08_027569 [Elysia crispata]|uniref:Uncharacterized protein n=1 Tax=Elysia crispata TaxID=231223 RepID=A0AAE1AGE2_9GAST|nr:hypothetical protein RRG08_027569 [Elysia crispata]